MKLNGKSVVVTGASSGMGKAIVERFAKEGANIIAVARRKERLEALAESLKDEPLLRGSNGLCVYKKGEGSTTLRIKDANGWWPDEKVVKTLAELPKPAPQQTDFIDSCKTRKTFALNESNGFRSCTMFNLGIAAERLGRGFEFDPVTLHAVDDPAADRFLYQSMREPWKTEMWG